MVETAEMDVTHREEDQSLEITKLKEQEAFRREFLGNLAHELKTPVFSIQGYILTLLDGGIDDPKVNKSFLERASKASDRMASMLEDLDQITKLEANELNLQQRSFDITELVTELIDAGEIFAKEKEIKVSLKKDYPSTFVVGNRDKIGQVFTNLINNAIFYGNKNGFCKIGLNYFDDIIEIEVCDDGPGIDAKHLPRLFERFYRVEKSRNRHEGGSGLGLAIAKHIIESHGHKITVKSVVGLGSNFYFTLNRSKNNVPHSSRGIPLK
jgi:two-component system phosphate regulon sensor histidine kinase PhoR